jgi:hypothetical protein
MMQAVVATAILENLVALTLAISTSAGVPS